MHAPTCSLQTGIYSILCSLKPALHRLSTASFARRTRCSVDLHAPRSGAQTVWARRVSGGVRKALLKDRGNQSKRRRLDEVAHSRGGASGQGPVGGHCRPSPSPGASPRSSVCYATGRLLSWIEKNRDLHVSARETRRPPDSMVWRGRLQRGAPVQDSSLQFQFRVSGLTWVGKWSVFLSLQAFRLYPKS